jgi:hypothetical protein
MEHFVLCEQLNKEAAMLTSPITLTLDAVTTDVHNIQPIGNAGTLYRSEDGTLTLKVSHQETKARTRRMARIDLTKVAADPLTAVNASQTGGVYIVIDEPIFGFSTAEMEDLVDALKLWLTSANITAMLGSRH